MTGALVVRFENRTVGRIEADALFRFTYDADWLGSPRAFAISVSLPLRAETWVGDPARSWFANLLPEGGAREAVCLRLGISTTNDLALLRAIGGECAGALTIVEPGEPAPERHRYEELDDRRLASLGVRGAAPLLIGGARARLSLAGAQNKLPVAVLDGGVHLPLDGAPSTHLLKLPHARFAHLPLNEAYVMGLAARIGFDVANVEVFVRTDPPSLLVERYDRRSSATEWPVARVHQEDVCQATGRPSSAKYEQEGGPSFAACVELVTRHAARPLLDVRRLIEWQAFNAVVGNCDGHGKNLSLLYEGPNVRLAPFYDLLSTRQYAGLDRRMAMAVGGLRDASELRRPQWEALAREAALGGRVVVDRVHDVIERCLAAVPGWTREYRERYGERAVLQTVPAWITRSARALDRQIKG